MNRVNEQHPDIRSKEFVTKAENYNDKFKQISKASKLSILITMNKVSEVQDYLSQVPGLLAQKSRAGQYYKLKHIMHEVTKKDQNFTTPLLLAVLQDSYEMVELLLVHGANVHEKLIENKTVLHYAVIMKNIKIVKLLLDFSKYLTSKQQQTKA